MNKIKLYGMFVLFVVSIFAASAMVYAAELQGPYEYGDGRSIFIGVEVNDVRLDLDDIINVEKTDEMEVLVTFKIEPDSDFNDEYIAKDVEIIAELTGYDHDDIIRDSSSVFNVRPDQLYDKKLKLELPIRLDQDRYSLKIRVEDRVMSKTFLYNLDVESEKHLIQIRDIIKD